jgi:hypothetical protein
VPGGRTGLDPAALAVCCVLAFAFAWLVAWPYVLPWYDGLGWAVLALLPASLPVAGTLDWLLLARTTALAFGYLPARGVAMPADLGWLQSVVRKGVTPLILLAVTVGLVVLLRRLRPPSANLTPVNVPFGGSGSTQSSIDHLGR